MTTDTQELPIDWIDGYVNRIKSHVFLREEDRLLIKVPNEAFKLNASGVSILRRLLDGETAGALLESHGGTNVIRRDLYDFFVALKQMLQGCLDEHNPPGAVETRPFALGFNTLPVLSEVALTYRCNLSCRFCYAGCSCIRQTGRSEMSEVDVQRILTIIRREAQVPSVSFTGGEPTLRPDLPQLIAYAKHEPGLRVNLITNGMLVDDALADALAGAGLDSAQVSIEASDPAIHEALTRVDGSHARSIAGARRLAEHGVHTHTNTTLTRINMEFAPDMPRFVREMGMTRLSMNMMIPAGSGEVESGLAPRYSEAEDVILAVRDAARREGVEFLWYSPTPICIFNPIAHRLGNKGCAACDGLLSVAPDGGVLPCSSWDEPVGNLLTASFNEVWGSTRAAWLRAKRFAPPQCDGCEDFALCQSACPLYWRHFGTSELDAAGGCHAVAES